MGINVSINGNKEEIQLTDFIIKRYNERYDVVDGKNEYMSSDLLGLELFGEVNLYDTTEEAKEYHKLSQWAKVTGP